MRRTNRRAFLSTCAGAAAGHAVTQGRPGGGSGWPSTFPALGQEINGRPLVYLDSAATTLRPQSVIDAVVDFYSTDNANPSRVHRLAARAADRLVSARQTVADFINAPGPSG
jgi:selenocysteine lyase/cysteine desulfurase